MDTIYVETANTTCYINGEQGIVRGLHYINGYVDGAFVKLAERDVMLYVTTGGVPSQGKAWREVANAYEIDRDEFDRLNGIVQLRRELGWR